MDHWLLTPCLSQKFQNAIFFKKSKIPFMGYQMGLEPHQNFFQIFFSTNMVARGVQSFCILEGATDLQIEQWLNLYACRPTIARIFQLNGNKSETTQDIDLKFSSFVHHMFGVNWHKNFSHCSISRSVAPSSMQKLCTPLATIFVEKKFWKKFWCGFRPIRVTPWREFLISWKKWRFEIFRTTAESRASDPWIMQKIIYHSARFLGWFVVS